MSKWLKLKSIAELTVGFVGTMAKHYENDGIPVNVNEKVSQALMKF